MLPALRRASAGPLRRLNRVALCVRLLSASAPPAGGAPPPIVVTKLGNGLRKHVRESAPDDASRPVVLVIGWMGSEPRHVDRIASQLWFQVDPELRTVYTFNPSFTDVLWPQTGVTSAQRLWELTQQINAEGGPGASRTILHGYSTAGFIYSMIVNHAVESGAAEKLPSGHKPYIGCVFDSAVDVKGIAAGMSRAMSRDPTVQRFASSAISTYLRVMEPIITKYYNLASVVFRALPPAFQSPVS